MRSGTSGGVSRRVKALAASAAARALLAHGSPVVVALHRHGASAVVRGTADVIFLSAPGAGLQPVHVVVRRCDLRLIAEAAAAADGEAALALDLAAARSFCPRLAPDPRAMRAPRARANLAAVAHWLQGWPEPCGLGEAPGAVLAARGRWAGLPALLAADAGVATDLPALIGLGAGSTPAGDDLVVGALAHAWASVGAGAPLCTAVRALAPRLPALTTVAGGTYLRAAVRGEFGSHLIAWVHALPRAPEARALALAERVAAHGATSGLDTLLGFVVAARPRRLTAGR